MKYLLSPERKAQLMEDFHAGEKKGWIKTVVFLVIGIIIISILGFDIRAAIEHPQTQENFSYLTNSAISIWNQYLSEIWTEIYNVIGPVINSLWDYVTNFSLEQFKSDQESFINSAPKLPTSN